MQTLTFNTKLKTAVLNDGKRGNSKILESFEKITTVKVREGYYEVMQEKTKEDMETTAIPIFRVPISNTNMVIIS